MSDIKSMMLPEVVEVDNFSANMPPTEIRTQTIYNRPRNSNNNSATFVIENSGILNMKTTKLVLQGLSSTTNSNKLAYPCNVGICSYIRRAILRGANAGGIICTSDNFANYFSITHNSFTSTERKVNYDRFTYGTMSGFNVVIDGLGNRYDGSGIANGNNQTNTIHSLKDTEDAGSNFSIELSSLFPGFNESDIPLYLLSQPLELEILFTPENTIGDRVVVCNGGNTTDKNNVADSQLLLMEDHVFFSDMRMEQIRSQYRNNPYTSTYNDLISTRNALSGATSTTSVRSTHTISGAGKIVSKVLCANPVTDVTDNSVFHAFGKYGSSGELEKKTFNLTVNNEKMFPIDVSNMNVAVMNAIFGSLYGNNYVEIPYSLQCKLQSIGMCDAQYNGQNDYADMFGQLNYFGCDLGESRVNAVPIELELFRHHSTAPGLKTEDLVVFLAIKRVFSILPNGNISVSYA
jgi:hypothetical protein